MSSELTGWAVALQQIGPCEFLAHRTVSPIPIAVGAIAAKDERTWVLEEGLAERYALPVENVCSLDDLCGKMHRAEVLLTNAA